MKYNAIEVATGAEFGTIEDTTFGSPSCTQVEAIAPPTAELTRSMPRPIVDSAPEPQDVDCEALLEKYCLAASPRCTWRSSGQNEGCHTSNEDV